MSAISPLYMAKSHVGWRSCEFLQPCVQMCEFNRTFPSCTSWCLTVSSNRLEVLFFTADVQFSAPKLSHVYVLLQTSSPSQLPKKPLLSDFSHVMLCRWMETCPALLCVLFHCLVRSRSLQPRTINSIIKKKQISHFETVNHLSS